MTASLTPPGEFPPATELGAAIWRAQRAIERAADTRLAPLGLATPAVRVLRLLAHEPGQSAADLARRLGLAPQSVALTIDRAGQAGLLERTPHPVHGRILQLSLTPAGRTAYDQAVRTLADLEGDLAAGLDTAARELLRSQLQVMAERAEAVAREQPVA